MKPSPYLILAGLGILALGIFIGSTTSDNEDAYLRLAAANSTVPVPLPKSMEVFGEKIPLDDPFVKESLSRELYSNTYWHSNTLLMLKRRTRWEESIRSLLREEGVPEDLVYLMAAESAFVPTALSPSGAAGFWQFMPATGKEHGLQVDTQIDERYHLEKSTRAAVTYLKRAHEKTGSWFLAAASYNMGLAGVLRQMERQNEKDYFRMVWNEETGRYAYRIAALKLILERPELYGYQVPPEELWRAEKGRTVIVDSSVANWGKWAQREGLSYMEFKRWNPWVRDYNFNNPTGQRIVLELPVKP
jgi:hypothetical protein